MISLTGLNLILPQLIIALAAIIVMLSIAVKRCHRFANLFTLLSFAAAAISVLYIPRGSFGVTSLFVVDGFGKFFTVLIACAGFVITLMSYHYLNAREKRNEEYYILLLLSSLGALTMVISDHFVSFFLSLEVLSVSLYALIGYLKEEPAGIESGIKYLVLAAVSSSFLLFGIALIYMQTGHLDLAGIAAGLSPTGEFSGVFIAGLAMVIVGIGFKMALVPFHLWTPDIYAGASAPVSAFVATVSKGAVFAFLLRLFYSTGGLENKNVWTVFTIIAVASMLFGNWLALRQQNIKRLLAYSSIGHLGYLMVAFLAITDRGMQAATFYLVVYFTGMLAAFGTVIYMTNKKGEALYIDDYRGLFWKKPWLAAIFTTVMLSLAGIPLTAGFLGKLYLLTAGTEVGIWLLVIILVVSSGIGLFYYLRVVAVMFAGKNENEASSEPVIGKIFPHGLVLTLLFLLLLWFGVYPSSLLEIIQQIASVIR